MRDRLAPLSRSKRTSRWHFDRKFAVSLAQEKGHFAWEITPISQFGMQTSNRPPERYYVADKLPAGLLRFVEAGHLQANMLYSPEKKI